MPAPRPVDERKKLHAGIHRLAARGLKVAAIAARLGCSRPAVYYVLARGGAATPRARRNSTRYAGWLAWRRAGMKWAEIARKARVKRGTAERGVKIALEHERKAVGS